MQEDPLPTRYSLLGRLGQEGSQGKYHWDQDWKQFYELYQGWICAIAWRCNLRPHEVDDVLQETMTRISRKLKNGDYDREKGRFRFYFAGIVRQCIKQALSRRLRHETRTQSISGEHTRGGTPKDLGIRDDKPLPDEEYERTVALALVQESLRDLVRFRWVTQERVDVFVALTFQDKSPAEVAEERGIHVNNVYAAKHAVIKRLTLMIHCKVERIRPEDVDPGAAPSVRMKACPQ